jgi:hypothetical protein
LRTSRVSLCHHPRVTFLTRSEAKSAVDIAMQALKQAEDAMCSAEWRADERSPYFHAWMNATKARNEAVNNLRDTEAHS